MGSRQCCSRRAALGWRSSGATAASATLDLGPAAAGPGGLVQIDLLGRVRPVAGASVAVGPTPVFLANLNLPAAKLRAGVALDRPMLESTFDAHVRRLTFANPTPGELRGTIALTPPAGWRATVEPAVISVAPGQTWDGAATLRLPYGTPAGEYELDAVLTLPAVSPTPVTVPLKVRVGLSDVGLRTLAVRDAAGEVIVQQTVTNYGERAVSYTAYLAAPSKARQDRLVTNLPAGKSVVKAYRVAGVAKGATMRSGLVELGGTRTLVEEVVAP